ncbi:MAG: FeoA family protein [Raineya sp.]|nr:ferrous iron transport protein A [Raineya sp.]MDW8295684.1 FeoA family protein [Raineya sp.]
MKLNEVPAGKKVKVQEYLQKGVFLKLLEMGVLPNATIEILGKAPLGCPIYIAVQDTFIALRKSEAQTLVIQEVQS